VALQQLLLPFPQFPSGGVTLQDSRAGSSYFESLDVRLGKRLSRDFSLVTNFAWNSYIERVAYLKPAFDTTSFNTISPQQLAGTKFAAPALGPTSSGFGLITAGTINPRQVQLGARLVW